MNITKGIQKLIDTSKAKGYSVEIEDTSLDIFKKTRTGKVIRGIRICENGWAYRLDINLSETILIKTQKDMAKILGLTP